jgi:hypothetical protein
MSTEVKDEPWNKIAPMSDEDIAELEAAAIRRWSSKPHYDGVGHMGSPGFHMRTHEVLALLARAKQVR